jgi:hypothetical protein
MTRYYEATPPEVNSGKCKDHIGVRGQGNFVGRCLVRVSRSLQRHFRFQLPVARLSGKMQRTISFFGND